MSTQTENTDMVEKSRDICAYNLQAAAVSNSHLT